jgi:hypothetical protein
MLVAEVENGPSIGAQASIGVSITGTGITPTAYGVNTIGISAPSAESSVSDLALFSYEVSAGVAKPIAIQMSLTGGVQIGGANFSVAQGAHGFAEFEGDFDSSLDWGGITSVVNARTGQPLAGWTVTSKSGFDYSQVFPPVPEPSSLALLLTALAGIAPRRRRPVIDRCQCLRDDAFRQHVGVRKISVLQKLTPQKIRLLLKPSMVIRSHPGPPCR